jgi:hypothetical protein
MRSRRLVIAALFFLLAAHAGAGKSDCLMLGRPCDRTNLRALLLLPAVDPTAIINAPNNQLVDGGFSFRLSFSYVFDLDATGFNPFLDVMLPTSTLRAAYLQGSVSASNPDYPVEVTSKVIPFFTNCTSAQLTQNVTCTNITYGCVPHPLAPTPLSAADPVPSVCGTSGDTYVSIALPFAAVATPLPPQVVTLSGLTMRSNLGLNPNASLTLPALLLTARAGYQFENLGAGLMGENMKFGEAQNRSETWSVQHRLRPQFMVRPISLPRPFFGAVWWL